ncbi:DUF1629 domain-containing protein, partial [Tenacibaculum maritimum]
MEYSNSFFLIRPTDDLNQIGYYPQVSLKEDYNPNLNGHWKVPHNEFPDFEPNLELKLHSKGKKSDYINLGDLRNSFIVSEKLKQILSEYKLPKHEFYPIKLYYKKELITYYWFYFIINDFWAFLNKEKSYAEVVNADHLDKIERIPIISREQILNEEMKFKFPFNVRTGKVFMTTEFPEY